MKLNAIILSLVFPSVVFAASIKITPKYPEIAIDKCIEGWAVVEFSVLQNGRTANILILESYPTGIFNDSAIEATKKLYYSRPRSEQDVHNVTNRYSYKLNLNSQQYAHCQKT